MEVPKEYTSEIVDKLGRTTMLGKPVSFEKAQKKTAGSGEERGGERSNNRERSRSDRSSYSDRGGNRGGFSDRAERGGFSSRFSSFDKKKKRSSY